MQTILSLNAHLKYVEYLLHVFDSDLDNKTLKEIRNEFEGKFLTRPPLLNQFFGIYRLLPLILMKEEYKRAGKALSDTIKQIKIIRDSIAHNSFSFDECGYQFSDGTRKISMTYDDIVKFVHIAENEFYKNNSNGNA